MTPESSPEKQGSTYQSDSVRQAPSLSHGDSYEDIISSLYRRSVTADKKGFQRSMPTMAKGRSSGDGVAMMATTAHEIYYSILSYINFLVVTWTRVLFVLPNIVLQPVDVFSVVAFAFVASLFLFLALVLTSIASLPIIDRRVQKRIDFLTVGPHGPKGVTEALYYTKFPQQLKDAAVKELCSPIQPDSEDGQKREKPRMIDLDVARYLISLCTLVYLRDPVAHLKTLNDEGPESLDPNRNIRTIAANNLQLHYAPLCELDQRHASPRHPSTASVGLFFSVAQPDFIVIAFKGTTPTSFPDWLIDFTYPYLPANAQLEAFGSVHEGFYRAIFPHDVSDYPGASGPWDLLQREIRLTIKHLYHLQGATKRPVNIWVTGHSLGAALAQVFYAKAIQSEHEWQVDISSESTAEEDEVDTAHRSGLLNAGSVGGGVTGTDTSGSRCARAIVRDCYTFGTPILSDVFSRGTFNHALSSPVDRSRRDVWRFVNRKDLVATALPALGDNTYRKGIMPAVISTSSDTGGLGGLSQFSFTHVGQEVKVRDGLGSFIGPGTLWPWGSRISIKGGEVPPVAKSSSGASSEANGTPMGTIGNVVRPYLASIPKSLVAMQDVPLLGRVTAHLPILYALQLEKAIASTFEGEEKLMPWGK